MKFFSIISWKLIILCSLIVQGGLYAQSPAPLPAAYNSGIKLNYVRSWVATAPISNPTEMLARPLKDVRQTTQYLDGLGRPLQTIVKQGSLVTGQSATDLVSPVVYDAFGREAYQYLPFASTSNDGQFKLDPFVQQAAFYNMQLSGQTGETNVGGTTRNWAYSKTLYEASPLNRVLGSFAPGASWVGSEGTGTERKTAAHYWINTAIDAVRIWTVTESAGTLGSYSSTATYPAGELYKNVSVDEHGKQVIEFKDKQGLVLLKKVQLTAAADNGTGAAHTNWLCTYYVYDDFNLLRAVIQPAGVEALNATSWSLTAALLKNQCFRYAYDGRHRMTHKQVPGAAVVYLIYDQWDRLVLTQDGNQRSKKEWLFTKYDALNRPVLTGLYTHGSVIDQAAMQAHLTTLNLARFEERNTTAPGYTLTASFPVVNATNIYTATYYDDYSWTSLYSSHGANYGSFDNTNNTKFLTASNSTWPYPQALTQSLATRGLVTGSYDNTGSGLVTSLIYDEKGRVIQTKQRNSTGGNDVVTTQYSFSGQPLRSLQVQQKAGTPVQTHLVQTSYSYDDLGRLLTTKKAVESTIAGVTGTVTTPDVMLAQNEYDALGQLKKKSLGQQQNETGAYTTTPVETLNHVYNSRGWLLGVNRSEMLTDNAQNPDHYFGYELGYDKITNTAGKNFAAAQYNGNITGMVWKSTTDGIRRKYDFGYDAIGRLLKGDFEQNDAGSTWGTAKVNFSMKMGDGASATSAYDANGNIKAMQQYGLTTSGSQLIDNLSYTYLSGTNKLQKVNDAVTADQYLGDFTDKNTGDDYGYDLNGNLVTDLNKGLRGTTGEDLTTGGAITYNHLNLPVQITVKDESNNLKGTITYTYDRGGNKLKKTVEDKTVSGKTITTSTSYLGGMVYESKTTVPTDTNNPDYTDKLQFIGHEEGRIRYSPPVETLAAKYSYDYFVKDHLGNVRMVLTGQAQTDFYPIASLEGDPNSSSSAISINKAFYQIDETKVTDRALINNLPTYANNNGIPTRVNATDSAQTSQKLYKLQALSGVGVTGLGITLKVTGGDKVSLFGKSFYNTSNSSAMNYTVPVLSLLEGLLGGGGTAGIKGVTAAGLNGITGINSAVNGFITKPGRDNTTTTTVPKAALNWILFDEQFGVVESGLGFKKVTAANILENLSMLDLPITKSGYLYVYCSNESPTPVFFDNLQVVHERSRVLEETHYYPFGLTMKGISSKSAGKMENKYLYNSKELESDFDLNWYHYGARVYDPQIARFPSIDPIAGQFPHVTPYNYAENEPVGSIDLWGLQRWKVNGREQKSPMPGWLTDARALGFASRHPVAASRIGAFQPGGTNISSVASRFARHFAEATNTKKEIGSESNALRHGIWSAMIRTEFSEGIAKRATNAHEGVGIADKQEVDFSQSFNGRGQEMRDLADHIVDVLNNGIGFSIAETNPNASAKELAQIVLGEFYNKGLWTFSADKKGNITISRTKISQSQYGTGMAKIISLDDNGFTPQERKELDDANRKQRESQLEVPTIFF